MNNINTKDIKSISGIYFIKNKLNKKIYIGQSVNIYKRLILHRFHLNNNIHDNSHLQRSFNKYGINNFKCDVIEYCNNLTEKEIFYINNQSNELYNIREVKDSIKHPKRKPISEVTRQKLINSKKGKIPKNLYNLQQNNKRKIVYYVNNEIIKIFNSCKEAAKYFNMKPNIFNLYINNTRIEKYFKQNERVEYYNEERR